ncbi:MAG: hypothetical protein Q8S00_10180 [Deltaproteobacteria bacterium]|nr:hypothetical protein [Deltaproteobacteria bacterium]MDZ4344549.1 hypothetical protein [Candidatus Binatia bacterium]
MDTFKLHYGDYSMVIRELAKGAGRQFRDARIVRPRLRDLHYSFPEIESLDRQGRGRRLNPEALPDANSLTNVLRIAGKVVDLKSGQLVGVTKSDDQCLEIRYENVRGGIQGEILDTSDLYSHFVSFLLEKGRPQPSAREPSEPGRNYTPRPSEVIVSLASYGLAGNRARFTKTSNDHE